MACESVRKCLCNGKVTKSRSFTKGRLWVVSGRVWLLVVYAYCRSIGFPHTQGLSLMRQVRHRSTSNAEKFSYFYCMITLLLGKNLFLWIANLKQLIDFLLTMGIFTDLTAKLTQPRAEGTYTFSWRQAGLQSKGNECKRWGPSARNVLPQSSELRPRDFFWRLTTFKAWATYGSTEPWLRHSLAACAHKQPLRISFSSTSQVLSTSSF